MKIWIALLPLVLCACVGGAGSYELDHGPADYDALKAAADKCHADGGQIALKSGYDEPRAFQLRVQARRVK